MEEWTEMGRRGARGKREGSEREEGSRGDEKKVGEEGETRSPIEDGGIALVQGDGLHVEALCPVDPTKDPHL